MSPLKSCLAAMTIVLAALPALAQAGKKATRKSSKLVVPAAVEQAIARISPNEIRAHTRYLSDDALEGRGPGTRGDDLTVAYIASRFDGYGLAPGGDNGTWFQKVPLIGSLMNADKTSLSFVPIGGGAPRELKYLDEFVASDQTQRDSSILDSELLFVGHGVVAPEYDWDDYKGVDVRGKTLVMLVEDPPATSAEPDLFKGKARTYYGRWTYKYETATQKGAAGAILIHTKDSAGYVWDVVRNSWGRERSAVKVKPGEPALKLAGWISESLAADLMKAAGQDLAAATSSAHSRDFRPIPLGQRLSGTIVSTVRGFATRNVIARLEGRDPALRDQAVLYTAHHDHLGIGKPRGDDAIYNGAIDNATGVATLLEMARVWSQVSPRPRRSIVFAAVAAEEQGLLGSEYYGENPTVPAGKIALNLNFDAIAQLGPVRNVTMNGVERTTFEPVARRVAGAMGMRIDPDEAPEQGYYYRSDHFSLAKVGIPAFSVDAGSEVIGKTKEWSKQQEIDYRDNRYHSPEDEFDPRWDFSAGAQIAKLGVWLGWEAANQNALPGWKPGDEFLAARERSQSGR